MAQSEVHPATIILDPTIQNLFEILSLVLELRLEEKWKDTNHSVCLHSVILCK
jgi:hypothetical protein